MKQKVYLSGPVRGMDFHEVSKKFKKAEKRFKAAGYKVVNPIKLIRRVNRKLGCVLDDDNPTDRALIMKLCIQQLTIADIIYMLDGWNKSDGAKLERYIAIELGIEVIYKSFSIIEHDKV